MADEVEQQEEERSYTCKQFFEEVAPGKPALVDPLAKRTGTYIGDNELILPELSLFCEKDSCNGFRLFESSNHFTLAPGDARNLFISYECKNCTDTSKTYAIRVFLDKDRKTGYIYKYGEISAFGPQTPPKVSAILGAERDYYFKGQRAENQGLGIAAFAYYRRVVENQKNKIFDQIIKTIEKVDPSNSILIAELESAKIEKQFTKAVDLIKHGIPQALLIDGHNPLTLLHDALSDGLHAKTDEECLEIATSIRIVLTDLVERMANAVKDSQELKSALSNIINRKNKEVKKDQSGVEGAHNA